MDIIRPESKQPIPDHAKKVFDGKLFDVYQWEQELYNGKKTIFEKIKRLDSVSIFPVLDDGRILLAEQEQPGKNNKFISSAGGMVDEGEDILEAAKRELVEETGYAAKEMQFWYAEQPITKVEWAIYFFIAKGLTKVAEVHLDGGEIIKPKPVTFAEFLDIAIQDNFYEKEMAHHVYEAKLNPDKMKELKRLFQPLG